MSYIVFSQNPVGDRVSFITEHAEKRSSLPYQKFIDYLFSNHPVVGRRKLLNCLDRFETIHLNTKTGEFRILEPEIAEDTSFEDLLALNRSQSEAENKKSDYVNKAKTFIDRIRKTKPLPNFFKGIGS